MGWIVALLYLGSAVGFYGYLIRRAPQMENDELERSHPSQLGAEILHLYEDTEERKAA